MKDFKKFRTMLSLMKVVALINVLATIVIFSFWFVNGYQPLPIVAVVWGLYFLIGNYSRFKLYKAIQTVPQEELEEQIFNKKEKKDVH